VLAVYSESNLARDTAVVLVQQFSVHPGSNGTANAKWDAAETNLKVVETVDLVENLRIDAMIS
jgi:hypothetical protein